MRLVVAITGASGAIYGIRILQMLSALGVETHLITSKHALLTLTTETDWTPDALRSLATHVHPVGDVGSAIASGSFQHDGMIIAPCSVKTLSGVANCYADNLVTRAADVTLKERRRLVLVFRETPLHVGHLRLLTQAAEMGATVFPPVPAFYHEPKIIDDLIDQTAGRVLDQFGLDAAVARWEGMRPLKQVVDEQGATEQILTDDPANG
ncbi:MAG: UbiX family flavin prenyltransferase [Nocardioidaceae bacterium]|nr:MAG: UbiX family flavin prenyltransferase [Nocardioidaceae bacterium]